MAASPPKLSLLLSLITTIYIFLSCTTTPVFSAGKPGPFACDVSKNPDLESFTFCNPSLDIETRVADLVNRLTLKEKIGWVVSGSEGVSRLGIPGYWWWSEALHGIGSNGPGSKFEPDNVRAATSFPQVILTAASFNVLKQIFKESPRLPKLTLQLTLHRIDDSLKRLTPTMYKYLGVCCN